MSSTKPELVTQSEARRQARELNANRIAGTPIAVAVPYPYNSWGGAEEGWTVTYVNDPRRSDAH